MGITPLQERAGVQSWHRRSRRDRAREPEEGETPFTGVVRRDPALTDADIIAYRKGKLTRYELPKNMAFIKTIPSNPAGTVLKRELRDSFSGPASE